jgi:hypothetical protein
MTAFYCQFETLPANIKVCPMPHEIMAGGLQGVLEGISLSWESSCEEGGLSHFTRRSVVRLY